MIEYNDKNTLLKLGPLARLDLFTDAVFAIVITLLAVEIRLPEHVEKGDLVGALVLMKPVFIAHLISFTVLGSEWVDHHSMFESTRKCTRALVGCNLLFCLTLTIIPFLTKLLGYFPDFKPAVVLYSAGIASMTFAKELIWQVISRQSGSEQRLPRENHNIMA
ncbi:MAG: TMEM175 family protein, partial [Verrucomicrobiota bacterium]